MKIFTPILNALLVNLHDNITHAISNEDKVKKYIIRKIIFVCYASTLNAT